MNVPSPLRLDRNKEIKKNISEKNISMILGEQVAAFQPISIIEEYTHLWTPRFPHLDEQGLFDILATLTVMAELCCNAMVCRICLQTKRTLLVFLLNQNQYLQTKDDIF